VLVYGSSVIINERNEDGRNPPAQRMTDYKGE